MLWIQENSSQLSLSKTWRDSEWMVELTIWKTWFRLSEIPLRIVIICWRESREISSWKKVTINKWSNNTETFGTECHLKRSIETTKIRQRTTNQNSMRQIRLILRFNQDLIKSKNILNSPSWVMISSLSSSPNPQISNLSNRILLRFRRCKNLIVRSLKILTQLNHSSLESTSSSTPSISWPDFPRPSKKKSPKKKLQSMFWKISLR